MMHKRLAGLGLIPEYQFSTDPAVNAKIKNVVYPDGMNQETIQPTGAAWGLGALGFDRRTPDPNYANGQYRNPRFARRGSYSADEMANDLAGALGRASSRAARKLTDKCCDEGQPCCWDANALQMQLRGLGMDNPFDSWGWENRKLLFGGGVILVGAAILAGLASVFK